MLIQIDPTSAEPLFEQLARSIRAEAARGALRSGERLPAARALATSLGINLHTVLRAYQLLRDEGLVSMRSGRGATVTAAVEQYARLGDEVPRTIEEAKRAGLGQEALIAIIREAWS